MTYTEHDEQAARLASEQLIGMAAYQIDWQDPEAIDEAELAGFVREQYTAGKARRRSWEIDAARQMAWVEGHQHLYWSADMDSLERRIMLEHGQALENAPFEQQRPVHINALRSYVNQKISLIMGGPASLVALAQSGSDDDLATATIATKLANYLWNEGVDPLRARFLHDALWTAYVTGIVWIVPEWDPCRGPVRRLARMHDDDEKGEGYAQELAQQIGVRPETLMRDKTGAVLLHAGEPTWKFRTGFDITEPEGARTVRDCDWILETCWNSMEHMIARYGDAARALVPGREAEDYYDAYKMQWAGPDRQDEVNNATAQPERVQTHYLWRPVRPWCRHGLLAVISQDLVLHVGPHPYAELSPHAGELPHVPLTEHPGQFFRPTSSVFDMMLLQERRNENRSQIAAHNWRSIAPKILRDANAKVPENAWDSQDREIEVRGVALADRPIDVFRLPDLPASSVQMDERYRSDMADVAGIHDSSFGRAESSQQSGKHAQVLLSRDASGMFIARENVRAAVKAAMQWSLFFWYAFARTERTIQVASGRYAMQALTFHGKNLVGNAKLGREPGPFDFNLMVELTGSAQAEETRQTVEMMTRLGYWNPADPRTRRKVERMLGEHHAADADRDTYHRANAARENQLFLAGKEVRCAYGDDDDAHVDEHDFFTTTPEYRLAVVKDARLPEKMRIHRMEHLIQKVGKSLDEQEAAAVEQSKRAAALRLFGLGGNGNVAPGAANPEAPAAEPAPVAPAPTAMGAAGGGAGQTEAADLGY